MDLTWRVLPLAHSSSVPQLLVSIDVQASSYTIRLTDLANIWVEEMERKTICMRGWSENTVIDPSDTPENMVQFLTHLRSALDSSQPGHEQTSVHLSPASTTDAGEGGLTLRITCELPGLQPLKWPIHLKMAPASSVATGLVLPLIQAQQSCQNQLESLTTMLAQKDAVLTKLLDKLEERGVGLDSVFTSLSSKRKVTRAAAEDKIKGLAPFDKTRWVKEEKDSQQSMDASVLLQSVFGDDGLACPMPGILGESPALDQWWKSFQSAASVPIRASQKSSDNKSESTSQSAPLAADDAETEGEDEDDGGFEVQDTPPHIKAKREQKAHSPPHLQESAIGSDDAASPPPRDKKSTSPTTSTSNRQRPASSRIGLVSGRINETHQKLTASEPGENKGNAQVGDNGSETASDVDEDATASIAESSPPPPPSARDSPPRQGRLGRIGGKEVAVQKDSTEEEEKAPPVASAPRQKIGLIGKKQSAEPESRASPHARGRDIENDPTADAKRETSQERAARRREELKRDLEKKAAAGPSKKKRKF